MKDLNLEDDTFYFTSQPPPTNFKTENASNKLTNGYSCHSNTNEEIPKTPSSPSPKFIAMPGSGHKAPPRKKSFKNGPGKRGDKHKKVDKITTLVPQNNVKGKSCSSVQREFIEIETEGDNDNINGKGSGGGNGSTGAGLSKKSNKVKLILPTSHANRPPPTFPNILPVKPEVGTHFPGYNSTRACPDVGTNFSGNKSMRACPEVGTNLADNISTRICPEEDTKLKPEVGTHFPGKNSTRACPAEVGTNFSGNKSMRSCPEVGTNFPGNNSTRDSEVPLDFMGNNSTRVCPEVVSLPGGVDYYFPDQDNSLVPDEDSEGGGDEYKPSYPPSYYRRTLPPLPPAKELPVDDIVIETLSMTLTTPVSPPPSPTPSSSPPNDLWAMRDNMVRVQKEKKELDVIRYDIEQQRLAEKMFPKYKPAQNLPPAPITKNGNLSNDEDEEPGSIETCRLLDASPVPKIGESPQKRDSRGEDARFFSKSRRRKSLNNLFPSPMSDCSNEEWTISSLTEPPRLSQLEEPFTSLPDSKDANNEECFTQSPTKVVESKPKVKEASDPNPYETTSSPSAHDDDCHCYPSDDSNKIYASIECDMVLPSTPKKPPQSHLPLNPSVLIEGVLFRASYLGSTHIYLSQWSNKRHSRTLQAKEAVTQVKACEGESQPRADVDLFISTEKIMVLNTNLQSEQVQVIKYEEIMMDHSLKTISYIADIGDIVVVMARRSLKNILTNNIGGDAAKDLLDKNEAIAGIGEIGNSEGACLSQQDDKMICHVFESEEAHLIAQSIGQAFQIAYMDFLKANGIEDTSLFQDMDYQDVLNAQEIFGEELALFAKKETQKEVVIPKAKGEILGIVIVESGWGSMIPTVVVANLLPGGPASRGRLLNIGDQVISINGISLVGLPLVNCQNYIKATQRQTVVKLTVVRCSPVVEVKIKRPDPKFQLGFSVQNGTICSLLRGGIAERGGVRVGHRIIEINGDSVVAVPHEKIVKILSTTIGEIHMKTMPTSIFRLLTGQETPTFL